MTSVALVTARQARDVDEDLQPLVDALSDLGVRATAVCWDDPRVDWASHSVAVLRSTWDYPSDYPGFLRWLEATNRLVPVLNPPGVVVWNTDKHYLRDLQVGGLRVVPTIFFEPSTGTEPHLNGLGGVVVVKPAIGAGGQGAGCYSSHEKALRRIRYLLEEGRSCLAQPYMSNIDAEGETDLIYIDGVFTHAVCKSAPLPIDADPSTALFIREEVAPITPSKPQRWLADVAARQFADGLLYARVDLVADRSGEPTILELEAAEPSLFFNLGAGSVEAFARAVERRLGSLEAGAPAATASDDTAVRGGE